MRAHPTPDVCHQRDGVRGLRRSHAGLRIRSPVIFNPGIDPPRVRVKRCGARGVVASRNRHIGASAGEWRSSCARSRAVTKSFGCGSAMARTPPGRPTPAPRPWAALARRGLSGKRCRQRAPARFCWRAAVRRGQRRLARTSNGWPRTRRLSRCRLGVRRTAQRSPSLP